jgi:hypothetical protein
VAGVLESVVQCDVLFAELVLGWCWAGEVDGGDGWWIGGGDGHLAGWGAVEGVFENSWDGFRISY